MYVNQRDSNGSAQIGETASIRFQRLAESLGWTCERSTREQDMFEHFDFTISNGCPYRVDVKARKRIARHGEFMDEKIWIELQGVNHSKGWLFGGHADYIAFEFGDGFWFASKKSIIDYICTLSLKVTDNPRDALYKAYTRRGRNDRVTMIRKDDIPYEMIWRDYSQETNLGTQSLTVTDTDALSASPQPKTPIISLREGYSMTTEGISFPTVHLSAEHTISRQSRQFLDAMRLDVPRE